MSVNFTRGLPPTTVEAVPEYLQELGIRLEEAFNQLDLEAVLNVEGVVLLSDLPTSDPLNAGQLWNNAGVVTVSSG